MLKVGIVGCGMIGKEHAKRIQYKIMGAEVVAVCDVFEAGAKAASDLIGGVKIYTDADALIADPEVDAVVVTTPGSCYNTRQLPQEPHPFRHQGRQARFH